MSINTPDDFSVSEQNNKNGKVEGTETPCQEEEVTKNELALASWMEDKYYERYKKGTYEECLREKWAIEGVLERGYAIDDKKDLKRKVDLLEYIVFRKGAELQRKGLPIPKVKSASQEAEENSEFYLRFGMTPSQFLMKNVQLDVGETVESPKKDLL